MQLIDCQVYSVKPAPAVMGMVPGAIITDFSATDMPDGGIDQGKLEKAAEQAVAAGATLLVDEERYSEDLRFNSRSIVVGNEAAIADSFAQLKAKNPTLKIAWGMTPSYYWPNRPTDAPGNLAALRASNLDPVQKPIYSAMDEFSPMVYFWSGSDGSLTPRDWFIEYLNSAYSEWLAVFPSGNVPFNPTISTRVFPARGVAGAPKFVDAATWLWELRFLKQFAGGAIKALRIFDDQSYDAAPTSLDKTPLYPVTVNFAKTEAAA